MSKSSGTVPHNGVRITEEQQTPLLCPLRKGTSPDLEHKGATLEWFLPCVKDECAMWGYALVMQSDGKTYVRLTCRLRHDS